MHYRIVLSLPLEVISPVAGRTEERKVFQRGIVLFKHNDDGTVTEWQLDKLSNLTNSEYIEAINQATYVKGVGDSTNEQVAHTTYTWDNLTAVQFDAAVQFLNQHTIQ